MAMQIFLEGNFMKFLMRLPCLREDSRLPSRGECTIFAVIVIYLREGSDNS